MKTLKRSRYYIFGNEGNAWYKDSNGNWSYINSNSNSTYRSPYDLPTDNQIIIRATIDLGVEIHCFTKEEYLEYLFIKNL